MRQSVQRGFIVVSLMFVAACKCGNPPPAMGVLKEEREACEHDEECVTGLCEAVPGFQPVCMRKCTAGCKSDEVCEQLTAGRFSCNPDRGGLCQTCAVDSDCPYPSDHCILVDNKGICGRDCAYDQNCPTSYRCLNAVGVDGKPRAQQCTPTSGSCACTAATAGQMISCQSKNAIGTCQGTQTCDGVMGYTACNARVPADERCNGIDDNCNGQTDEGLPEVTCGVGACRRATPLCGDGGVLTCTPGTPSAETCNGIDDDCDGTTDNGFNLQSDVSNCGTCGKTCAFPHSTPRCASGTCEVLSCDMGYGNCNGVFADGCEVNLKTDLNNCGACSRACEAPGADSTCSNGVCQYTCQPGFYDINRLRADGCEYACTFRSATEVCNGLDDDCNGQTDEGFNLQSDLTNCGVCGRTCGFANANPRCVSGVCEILTCTQGYFNCNGLLTDGCEVNLTNDLQNCGQCNKQCSAAGADSTCSNSTCNYTCRPNFYDLDNNRANGCEYACTFRSATETCNSLDDNCDGRTDEGFNLQTDINNCGQCGRRCTFSNATPTCATGNCEVATCNTGYFNCNGQSSDGCEINLTNDVNNCGSCNNVCSAPGSDGTCVNRQCQYACKPNFYDLDGNAANGCEYACTFTSAVDEPDVNFTDANCDGIDGELNNGIFVAPAPLGNDANAGTMAAPKATILAGVQAAVAQSKRDVYVLMGTYTGPITLTGFTGKDIAGGYAVQSGRWVRSSLNTTTIAGGNPALTLDSSNNTMVQGFTIRGDNANGVDSNGHGNSAYGAVVRNLTGARLERLQIQAGNGVNGIDGTNGSAGSNGGNGGAGNVGCEEDGSLLCGNCNQPVGGTGGISSCGRAGGAGGLPGRTDTGFGSSGIIGQINTFAGSGSAPNSDSSGTYNVPYASQQGTNGTAGGAGSSGSVSAVLGTLVAGGYLPPVGGSGVAGTPGMGGGGGGGGGGGCTARYVGPIEFCLCYTYGSSGGGGGAGGCGGVAGSPGKGGGASVALTLFNATVTSSQQLTLTSGNGGNGGRGGSGGAGGTGGTGASSVHSWGQQGYSQIGGKGGNGGTGGAGGNGAGGAGGPSFGLLRNAASTSLTGFGFTSGSAGLGGTSNGPNGLVAASQQL